VTDIKQPNLRTDGFMFRHDRMILHGHGPARKVDQTSLMSFAPFMERRCFGRIHGFYGSSVSYEQASKKSVQRLTLDLSLVEYPQKST
jgi:hypothetical protein